MGFRTNKMPVLQNKSASGAIASFDTILTKPLEECTSLITGYQEGSGTPSPSNVRPLRAFNSATLTANSDSYAFTFGQDIYQGSIDWKRGVVVGTHKIKTIDSNTAIYIGTDTNIFYINDFFDIKGDTESIVCSTFVRNNVNYYTIANAQAYMQDLAYCCVIGLKRILIKNTAWSSVNDFLTWLGSGHVDFAIKLANPITIPLGGVNILTQEGQNNIFADTGDTSVVFNDLDIAKKGSFREVFKLP